MRSVIFLFKVCYFRMVFCPDLCYALFPENERRQIQKQTLINPKWNVDKYIYQRLFLQKPTFLF